MNSCDLHLNQTKDVIASKLAASNFEITGKKVELFHTFLISVAAFSSIWEGNRPAKAGIF